MELLIAKNPDPDSSLPYLLHVPLSGGLVFRTKGVWPRTSALYCHPVPVAEWPETPELVEQLPLRSCSRRGAAIDLVVDRARENRSQIVFSTARGRDVVFWQGPRTRKQARPQVRTPTARASGLTPDWTIVVDAHERYPYRFDTQQVQTERRALPAGDYGVEVDGRLVASVERKSLEDLISSVTSGRLRFAITELATLPRAAVVVEDRYSRIFGQTFARPAAVADALAELQVRWPEVPVLFCENRKLAEEWTYRFLGAALVWARDEPAAIERMAAPSEQPGPSQVEAPPAAEPPTSAPPTTAVVRAWAVQQGLPVSDRGRLRPEIWRAWETAHHPVSG